MRFGRRLGWAVLGMTTVVVVAQGPAVPAWTTPGMHAGTEILLWPDKADGTNWAPGAMGETAKDRPTIRVYLPKVPNVTKTAVIIAPGGGYGGLAINKEGEDCALFLNARGVAAFVLRYRLAPYRHPIEIGDAHRAIRTVRARAAEYGIAPDHIGVWGFSAGGHLMATAETRYDAGDAASSDPIERMSSRPAFAILSYPVVTLEDPLAHKGSRTNLLGPNPDPALEAELSAEKRVTADTPPTFIFSTTDDGSVPVLNSVMFYEALVRNKVPAELHLFQHGPHGVGLAPGYPDLKIWPELLATWMRARGLMGPAA
jgi:acetyl esterase/lipase